MTTPVVNHTHQHRSSPQRKPKSLVPSSPEGVKESPSDTGAQEKNNIVIPEFSAWLTLVLEQCRAENIRNLPRQRAPTPLFPERRPREACSMPISGCHDLPLATFNLPSRVFRHGCRRAECPKRRWGGFFHTLSRGQHMLPQQPSKQTATAPRPSVSFSRPAGAAAPEIPPYSFRRRFKGGSFAARAKPAAPAPRKTATAPKTSPKAAAHCGDHASSKTCSTAA